MPGMYGEFLEDEHTLADMDAYQAFEDKANEHWDSTVDQYVQSYSSWISRADEEIESWPEDLEANLIQVFTYHVKPGHDQQFNEAMQKIHEGLVEVNWSEPYAVDRVVSGAPGTLVSLVLPFRDFADMADPEKSFDAALAEAHGKGEAGKLMEQISDAYDHVDEVLVRVDPELSLMLDNEGSSE